MGRAVALRLAGLLAAVLALVLGAGGRARAEEAISLEEQDLTAWETLWDEYFPGEDLMGFLKAVMAGESPDLGAALQAALKGQGEDWLRQGVSAVVRLIILVVLEVLILYISQGMQGASAARAGHMVVLAAAVLFVGSQCLEAMRATLAALDRIGGFLNAAIPVLTPLLVASGWTATSGLLQPATLGLSALMNYWLKPILSQAVSMAMLLRMADSFAKTEKLSGIIALIKSAVQWFLGLCLTGFVAIVGIQASAMLSYDSLALRSARYAVDATIPGVGGLFADMLDTAVISAQLIRNSLGVASLLALVMVCLEPVLHLLSLILSLEAAAALGGVLGKTALSALFKDQAELAKLLLYSLLAAALLVLVMVSLACMAGVRA